MKDATQPHSRIILVRHGETEWNRLRRFQGRSDIPLNDRGYEQAQALAQALQNERLTAIHSSPLTRALETAHLIGGFHPNVPVFKEPELVEMNLGDFEGMEAAEWAAQHKDFRERWQQHPAALAMPKGESLEEVQHRAATALRRITGAYSSGSTLLLCSHNFVIASLLCFASQTPLDHFRQMRQETSAMNTIIMDGSDFRVEKINDTEHLTSTP